MLSKNTRTTAELSSRTGSRNDDTLYSVSSNNTKAEVNNQQCLPGALQASGTLGGGFFGLSCMKVDLPAIEANTEPRTKSEIRPPVEQVRLSGLSKVKKHSKKSKDQSNHSLQEKTVDTSGDQGCAPDDMWAPFYQVMDEKARAEDQGKQGRNPALSKKKDIGSHKPPSKVKKNKSRRKEVEDDVEGSDSISTVSDLSTEDPTSVRVFDANGKITKAARELMRFEEAKAKPEDSFIIPVKISFAQKSVAPKRLVEL